MIGKVTQCVTVVLFTSGLVFSYNTTEYKLYVLKILRLCKIYIVSLVSVEAETGKVPLWNTTFK